VCEIPRVSKQCEGIRGKNMLRRRPTRIELKPEDKEEYEQIRAEKAAAEAAAAAKASGGMDITPFNLRLNQKQTVQQRIGFKG
jgi:hypothetical protein